MNSNHKLYVHILYSINFYALVQWTLPIIKTEVNFNSEYLVCHRLSEGFRKCPTLRYRLCAIYFILQETPATEREERFRERKGRIATARVCSRVERLERHKRVTMFILLIGLVLVLSPQISASDFVILWKWIYFDVQ